MLFGSKVATTDGAVSASSRGYIWQPYEVCSFGHVYAADPNLAEAIAKQRREWQKLDLLSKRDFPAQILVTWTGEKKHAQHDFLASRIFHEKLPTGLPMEAYIVTSERGAWNIRQRAADFSLQNRIEDMLIVLPPSAFSPSGDDLHVSSNNTTTATDFETDGLSVDMDLSLLPTYLYEHLDIRVANHDGGRDVLRAFARAGALSQLNLTLCQDRSAVEVLRGNSSYVVESGVHPSEYEDPALESKLQYFFDSANLISSGSNSSTRSSDTISNSSGVSSTEGDVLDVHEANTTTKRGVPRHLEVVEVAQGVVDPVMIVTLKAKTDMFDF